MDLGAIIQYYYYYLFYLDTNSYEKNEFLILSWMLKYNTHIIYNVYYTSEGNFYFSGNKLFSECLNFTLICFSVVIVNIIHEFAKIIIQYLQKQNYCLSINTFIIDIAFVAIIWSLFTGFYIF